ncbi:MAG: hypothetical protein ABI862_16380 [Ilumatobacteraceae bacterium]
MRQFVSFRFWLAIAALVGLTYGLWYVLIRDDSSVAVLGLPAEAATAVHRINLVQPVYSIQADPGFAVADGVSSGEMRLTLDAARTMVVEPGTPGQISCSRLAEINQCVVAADLLGDAVVWFSLIPNPQRASLLLPGITEVRKDNWVLLSNGWEVARNDVVERNCDATGLDDFVRQFGGNLSTSTFSFEQQEITKVTCLEEPESSTTTSTSTTLVAPVAPIDTSVIVGEEVPIDEVPPAGPVETVAP